MKLKLTQRAVEQLGLLDGQNELIAWDTELRGFGFRLQGSRKTWVLQYKCHGATRRMTLAADAVSAEAARTWARKIRAKVDLGADPSRDKKERAAKDKDTLGALIETYLAHKKVKPRTLRALTHYLTVSLKPLRAMPVDRITRRHIAERLLAIADDHSGIVVAKARQAMMGLFAWAMGQGLLDEGKANPVIGTEKPKEGKPRERVLRDDELVRVWNACEDGSDFSKITRLLILLGARRQEIGGTKWDEFSDLDGPKPSWTLPAARSKNGRAHTLPLLPMALGIIKSVPRMATRDHLFGAHSASGFTKWDLCKQELDARSGVGSMTLHDLRRSTATKMADIGVQPHIIEAVLNHQSGHKAGPAGIYNRSNYDRDVRVALAMWEDHLRSLIEGGERKVVSFPQTSA
jgi:integrase